jgi:hypothetical protein
MATDEAVRLIDKNKELPASFKVLKSFLLRKKANIEWLLLIISYLNKEHEYFRMNYAPPRASKAAFAPINIVDDENFLRSLPESRSKAKRSSQTFGVSRVDRAEYELKVVLARQAKLSQQL